MTTTLRLALLAAATVLLGACSTIDRSTAPAIDRQAQWVVLPFANHTETPLAGQRAEAIAETILHSNGINKIKRYPGNLQQEALFDAGERKQQEEALAWARQQGARYALTGAVDEWRYKVASMVNRRLVLPCKSSTSPAATPCGAVLVARAAGAAKPSRLSPSN